MNETLHQLKTFLTVRELSDPIEWIQNNMSLRWDPTSADDGMVKLEPYQIRPIKAQYHPNVREVTIMAVEQSGKSFCWRMPMVHKMLEYPGPRWIIYESDDKAADINAEQFDPLLKKAPGMHRMLNRHTATKRRYNLPNGSTLDFNGAGADITSKPKRDGVADELDTWPLTEDGIRQNLRNFKKRFRTYWRRGEGCLVKVSSPSPRKKGSQQDMTRSIIGEEFDKSDAGYWTLRCLKCRSLSMPSHATYMLQWETDDDGKVVESSMVMECPKCGHRHTERNAQKMNNMGAYATKGGKDLSDEWGRHVGCQWGSLAAPRVFKWLDIAEAQMQAGSTADMYAQADYDNSWRGIPFRPRRSTPVEMQEFKKHCAPLPDPDTVANIFFSADTQDNGWYYVVRAIDQNECLYLLRYGFVDTITELKAEWDKKELGILPVMGIIDEGGHGNMPTMARELIKQEPGLYSYKGGGFGKKFNYVKAEQRILGAAQQYKADLLHYITKQKDRQNSYWFLPPTVTDEYATQLTCYQTNNRVRNGDLLINWDKKTKNAPDHYFDCEKQILCLLDVAYEELKPEQWRLPMPRMRKGNANKGQRKAPRIAL